MLDYFLRRSINNGLKNNHRKHMFLNFECINRVLVLFDIDNWQNIAPIVNDLVKNKKQVILWTIKPKAWQGKEDWASQSLRVRVIDLQTDLNWFRLIRKPIMHEFLNLEYDTCIDLTEHSNDYSRLLLIRNKSEFCLGFVKSEEKLYDFAILKEDDQTLFEAYLQLKIYLAHIE